MTVPVYFNNKAVSAGEDLLHALIKMGETADSHLDGIINNAGMTVPAYFNNFQCQAIKNISLITDFNIFYTLNKLNVIMIVHDFELNLASYATSLLALQISKDKLSTAMNSNLEKAYKLAN
ncbi:heat shock protein 70 [Coccidioides immitis RS]|uniref:Heat shock protein 70 n=1 Tax=Coccidioides immitis (strain RS) TaxID=246410 RepID=J3K315_COCIM|nr:heat shock protein 70 [Coccidioides immitis RS]EAS28530.3 heat shock protein 70 [Coccidioides immitis RS]